MKTFKSILFIFLAATLLIGCNGKKSDGSKSENDSVITTVFTVDSLLASADQLVGKIITVEGDCSHLCTHSGKKLFLAGSADSVTIRAQSEKPFRQECINKKVSVTGKMIEERIDEAYLVNWENEIKADTASHDGCETEKKAVGQKGVGDADERIANFRNRIAEEKAKTGKDYLAFYHIETKNYRVVE